MRNVRDLRKLVALLLAAAILCVNGLPAGASEATESTTETVVQPPETEPVETPAEQTEEPPTTETTAYMEPTMSTLPAGTEETIPNTEPEETENAVFKSLLSRMEALEEETSAEELGVVWNDVYDAYDQGLLTEEQWETLDELGWRILESLEEEPKDDRTTLEISRHGSRETPMAATAENSVATLGSGSGIKFRIFNYTNGKDAQGNYIFSGGVNDNGLSGYFDFRGTSYENTGADGKTINSVINSATDVDGFTANHATVLPNLGADGYPVFDGSRGGGPRKSLGYLFGAGGKGVTGYAPGNTLLRINSRGQYYYNSAENAVDFDTASNRFIVRTYRERGQTTAGMGSGQYYDFFPFTYWNGATKEQSGTANWYNYNNTEEVDYWFGMTMEAAFSMPAGGMVEQDAMVFEFSGDDDVWVFIDDVLVLDLGGTHGVVSGSINFATGEVKQYLDWNGAGEGSVGTSRPTTLKARFAAAGKEPKGGWNGNVFADYSQHTIKFYYLERATSCANCKILFNMPILPTGKLTVEKQLEGQATDLTVGKDYGFTLVRKTETGELPGAGLGFDRIDVATGQVLETGTTDDRGGFTLKAGQRAEFDLTAGKTFLVRETDPGQYAQPLASETDPVTIDPEIPAQLVFTNRLKTTTLTLRKQVAGNMGDRDQFFGFRVMLYTGDPAAGGKLLEQRQASLKHGEEMCLETIPIGAWVVVTEEGAEDYETGWKTASASGSGKTGTIGTVTEPVSILYTNTRDQLIETGVALDTAPYLLMTVGGILPLLRRRKRG